MPNPRIINTWDDVLKDYHDYSWDTKGMIADAINVAADGVVTVSQNGNYYDYGEAIRQMDKKIWSSANEPTNPRKQVKKTFPNYAEAQEFCTRIDELGVETVTDVTQNADGTVTVTYLTYCVIRNSDLAPGYGKYTNYGYVDINELSEKRFGDYDKYHAASSFYVDIYNPPVYVIGDLLVGPCTLTNKSCKVTDTELEASRLWRKFAAAYPNATDIFPGDGNNLTIRPVMLNYDYTTFLSSNDGLMTLCNSTLEKVSDVLDWKKSWRVVKSSIGERSYIGRGTSYSDGDIISMESGDDTFYFRKSRHSTTAPSVFVWYNVTDKVVN